MPKSRVAFIGNHSRTITFAHIARHLERENIDVFWIMPGAQFRIDFLKKFGFSSDNILDISKHKLSVDDEILKEIESFSDVSLSYMIMSDRILRDEKNPYAYLCAVYSSVKEYLVKNRISIVFSEATWALELVSAAAAKSVGVQFIVPHTVRYPQNRFAFFKDIFQSEIIDTKRVTGLGVISSVFSERHNEPELVSVRNIKGFLRHFWLMLSGGGRDMVSYSLFQLIKDRVVRKYNSVTSAFKSMPASVDGEYVYMPLHCQPEASIDVLGGFYSGQLELIKNIARSLPFGVKLAVKEHPVGLGMRPASFFREISRLPNVVSISPYADSRGLIKKAKAVVSVSGTACYEAALLGVGSVVFTDVFFSELPTAIRCKSSEDIGRCIKAAMEAERDMYAVIKFISEIYRVSYEGCVEPAELYPQAIKEENARKVSQAFIDVINYSSSVSGCLTAASMSSK